MQTRRKSQCKHSLTHCNVVYIGLNLLVACGIAFCGLSLDCLQLRQNVNEILLWMFLLLGDKTVSSHNTWWDVH